MRLPVLRSPNRRSNRIPKASRDAIKARIAKHRAAAH